MTGTEIYLGRSRCRITQGQLAALIGVHPMSIWKWENGKASPNPYQEALLRAFQRAESASPGVVGRAARELPRTGVPAALALILRAAYPDPGAET